MSRYTWLAAVWSLHKSSLAEPDLLISVMQDQSQGKILMGSKTEFCMPQKVRSWNKIAKRKYQSRKLKLIVHTNLKN